MSLDFGFWIDDFGLTPPNKCRDWRFGIDVSEAYAAQRVFFRLEGRSLYQIFWI